MYKKSRSFSNYDINNINDDINKCGGFNILYIIPYGHLQLRYYIVFYIDIIWIFNFKRIITL